jgi:hypothetical protein
MPRASEHASAPVPIVQKWIDLLGAGQSRYALVIYFKAVDTEVKVVLRLEPTPATATIIAIEMPAAIRPYSMAVAPE